MQEARSIGKKTENATPAVHLREINEEVYKAAAPLRGHLKQKGAADRNGGREEREGEGDKKKRMIPVNMRGCV